ncbi:hypothetical protein [Sphingobacterium corticibacterium]|uniref:Uncharacterized protein n=1 Tax=Sphingobacterium corticibacterium TaxID=2484746 RepID=A0A4Q6XRW6_9SPHI|nr:hypothetical protein [Sphingobacterium corticibacterium]RZF60242.1 hypothetical protein EWE74_14135 [Sphingobacterium corticibacterium]
MARQESLIKLKGKIGDLSFYKDKRNGYQARMKGGPTKDQINNDPRFQRTRENGQEFGRAVQASKLVRQQLYELLQQAGDAQLSNRMTSRMHQVLKADEVNARGERQVLVENLSMLVGIDFNINAQLRNVFLAKVTPSYSRDTGAGTLELPVFKVKNKIKAPGGGTHAQLQLVALEFDATDPNADSVSIAQSNYLDIGKSEDTEAEILTVDLQPKSESAVLIMMGIAYFQFVNGGYYPLANGQYNALTIVDVDIP